ncbi:unnamed protein product [Larinioides sclopetarius]|uniref:Uncharacterized protein n=1 Tax=Larinioides sclopetarius TaxID=280406 RepID=A0AAV1ZJN1_9ARAC
MWTDKIYEKFELESSWMVSMRAADHPLYCVQTFPRAFFICFHTW